MALTKPVINGGGWAKPVEQPAWIQWMEEQGIPPPQPTTQIPTPLKPVQAIPWWEMTIPPKVTPLPFPVTPPVSGKRTQEMGPYAHFGEEIREIVPLKDEARVFGESLKYLPKLTAASLLQATQGQGGASVVNRDWADIFIAEANEDIDKFVKDIVKQYPSSPYLHEVAQLSRNMGYSGISMGAGGAVGAAIAWIPLPGARVAAWATGSAVSGAVAYQMTTYQIMQQYLELKNAEKIEQTGKGLTLEEENRLKQDFHSKAVKYGLWEAIPEAISNLLFGQLLFGPLSKMIGGPMATQIITKLAGMYGEELLTETITQKGQSGIEVEAGLREKRIGWAEAFREIAPQTFLLTTLMGGAGQVVVSSSQAIQRGVASLKNEIGETHPLYETIKEGIEKGWETTTITPAETTAALGWETTTGEALEGMPMPTQIQQEFLLQAQTWLEQVPQVTPNSLHTIGVPNGEGVVRTDSQGNPLVAALSLMREGQLTLSTLVANPQGGMAVGRGLADIGEYLKENNIAFPPREEMSPQAIRIYDKLVARGEVPDYAMTQAMAEWDTFAMAEGGTVSGMSPEGIQVPEEGITPEAVEVVAKVNPFPETSAIISDLTKTTIARRVARLPVIRRIMSLITKIPLAKDPITQAYILRGRMQDMAGSFTNVATVHLRSLVAHNAKPKVKNGIVVDKLVTPKENAPLADGKPSMHLHDIIEFADRYNMPANYREYVSEIRELSRQTTAMLEAELAKHDIILRKTQGESDWVYLRRVVAQVGDVETMRFTDWRGTQKPRSFETAMAGVEAEKKPVTYLDPDLEITYQIQAAYNWITKLRVNEIINQLSTTAKARVPAKYVNNLIETNEARIVANKLLGREPYTSLITRAGRGEVLAPQTMAMVERAFPDIASELSELINRKAKPREFTAFRKRVSPQLNSAVQNFRDAKDEYRRALAQAGPAIDEGTGVYLPGRIFTTQTLAGKRVLGRDILQQIDAQFGWNKPGIAERIIQKLGKVGTILRQTKASLDLSVQGIQTQAALGLDVANIIKAPARLAFGIPAKPSASWLRGAFRGWQRLFQPRASLAWLDRADIKTASLEMIEHGAELSRSEFAEATDILSKIPVLGKLYEWTGAAFTVGRTATQILLYMGERARALRGVTDPNAISQRLDELARWSNLATGTFSTRAAGISANQRAVENVLFFSSRLNRAVFSNLIESTKPGYKGKMARDSIIGLMAATVTLMTFLAIALGQKPRLNPLPENMGGDGAKFLTIKIGPTYIGVGGTYYALARLLASNWDALMNHPEDLLTFSMDNPNVRFVRSKFGPPAALITDFTTGHDYLGELTTDNFGSVAKTFGEWGIPIWVEGMTETIMQDAAPWEVGAAAGAEFFGGRTFPESDWDIVRNLREIYADTEYGKQYEELTNEQVKELRRKHPDLAELEEKSKEHWAATGTKFEQWYYSYRQEAVRRRNDGILEAAQALLEGRISKKEFDSDLKYWRYTYTGNMAALWDAKQNLDPRGVQRIERWLGDNQSPADKALSEYLEHRMSLIDEAELPKDWDEIEKGCTDYLKKYSADIQNYVIRNQTAWMLDLPEEAREVMLMREAGIADETWWKAYAGLVAELHSISQLGQTIEDEETYTTDKLRSDIATALYGADPETAIAKYGYGTLVPAYQEYVRIKEAYDDIPSDDRLDYRRQNPTVDANLFFWSYVISLQSDGARLIVQQMISKFRIPTSAIRGYEKGVGVKKSTAPWWEQPSQKESSGYWWENGMGMGAGGGGLGLSATPIQASPNGTSPTSSPSWLTDPSQMPGFVHTPEAAPTDTAMGKYPWTGWEPQDVEDEGEPSEASISKLMDKHGFTHEDARLSLASLNKVDFTYQDQKIETEEQLFALIDRMVKEFTPHEAMEQLYEAAWGSKPGPEISMEEYYARQAEEQYPKRIPQRIIDTLPELSPYSNRAYIAEKAYEYEIWDAVNIDPKKDPNKWTSDEMQQLLEVLETKDPNLMPGFQPVRDFLAKSNVSEKQYVPFFQDCVQFTRDLLREADLANLPIGAATLTFKNLKVGHRIAWIKVGGRIFYIEPQSDTIMTKQELLSMWADAQIIDIIRLDQDGIVEVETESGETQRMEWWQIGKWVERPGFIPGFVLYKGLRDILDMWDRKTMRKFREVIQAIEAKLIGGRA